MTQVVVEGLKGTSKYVLRSARAVRFFGIKSPYGGHPVATLNIVQWLELRRQRPSLKLVFNRLVRTRMLGGVGGNPEQSGSLSRLSLVIRRLGFDLGIERVIQRTAFRFPCYGSC